MAALVPPRFYPILDAASLERLQQDPRQVAAGLMRAGAGILQYRWKGPYTREAYENAVAVGQIVKAAGAIYVVNDRADIALAAGADGVHVGQDDLPPAAIRRFCPKTLNLGLSTHSEAQLRDSQQAPIDWVALGPIYHTGSKEKADPQLGLEELRRLAPLAQRPLVAIGGLTLENAPSVLQAGAASCAVISDWMRDDWEERAAAWARL